MRIKRAVLLAFLLVLYIGPLLFISSYASSATPTEKNMTKEFTPATEYTTSDQSITSFSETLPDDVLFYPDAFVNTTPNLATDGTGTPAPTGSYTLTHSVDTGAIFNIDVSSPYATILSLEFGGIPTLTAINFDSLTINLLGQTYSTDGSVTTHDLEIWNGGYWITYGEIYDAGFGSNYGWTNVTLTDYDFVDYGFERVNIRASCVDDASLSTAFKYAEVTFSYMTLADVDHYAEGFTNVTDWSQSLGGDWGTDSDLMFVDVPNDGGSDSYYSNGPSLPADFTFYYEFRAKVNISYNCLISFYTWSADDAAGNNWWSSNLYFADTYVTKKGLVNTAYAIESLKIFFTVPVGAPSGAKFTLDYFRISPANESGWQHDGSITDGVEAFTGGSISTDGDYLSLISDGDGSIINFSIDTTSTRSSVALASYQFLKIKIHDSDVGNDLRLRVQYYDDTWNTLVNQFTTDTATLRFNIGFVGTYIKTIQLFVYSSQTTRLDYIKAYSIANWTAAIQGYQGVNDYLYVSSGTLYSINQNSPNFWWLDYDPSLSVDTDTPISSTWTMTTSSGTPEVNFYVSGWLGYTSDTSGTFPTGTLTDLRLKFTDSANVEAITFFSPIPQWNEIDDLELIFIVPVDETGLNMLLVFLGLIMIPTSTIYAAKGGLKDASTNKLFYVLIIFFLGWGLLLGGIYA